MAYPLLQILDDDGNVALDLNTGDSYVSPESFDLGVPQLEDNYFLPSASDGARLATSRLRPAEMSWSQHLVGSSIDDARSQVNEIARLLRAGPVIKYQHDATSEVRYIDTLSLSEVPSWLRGSYGVPAQYVTMTKRVEGMPVRLLRQPLLRGEELDSDVNKLKNSTLLWGTTTPGLWDWDDAGTVSSEEIISDEVGPLPGWEGAFAASLEVEDYVTDSFDRADSAVSLGDADSEQTWTAHKGTWGTSLNNAYVATPVADDNFASVDSGQANVTIEADFDPSPTSGRTSAGLLARRHASTNSHLFFRYMTNSGAGRVQLYKVVSGSYTQLGSTVTIGRRAGTMRLSLTVSGNDITCRVDGLPVITASDSAGAANTRHGLFLWSAAAEDDGGSRWQNFEITPVKTYAGGDPSSLDSLDPVYVQGGGATLVSNGSPAWKATKVHEPGNAIEDPNPTDPARKFIFTYSGQDASGNVDIGAIFSADGGAGGTWVDYASNPIVSLGEDPYIVKDITTGKAYRDANGLHMFSETKTAGSAGSQSGIQHHYSTDGITWTADPANPVIGPGADWEASDRTSPVVFWDGAEFTMLYEGRTLSTQMGKVGVARKATIMGTGWAHEATNPVVGYNADWALTSVVPDDIFRSGSTYILTVHGENAFSEWAIGRYSTTDAPADWDSSSFTEMEGNPIEFTAGGHMMPMDATGSAVVRGLSAGTSLSFGTTVTGYEEDASDVTNALQQSTAAASAALGDTWALSFYAKKGAAGTATAKPVIEYQDSSDVTQTTSAASDTTLSTVWQRIEHPFTATDADTDRILASLSVTASPDATVYLAAAQLEEAPEATLYRVGTETVYNDPASTSGYGRVFPVYVHGDTHTQANIYNKASGTMKSVLLGSTATSSGLANYLNSRKVYQAESGIIGGAGVDTASGADANASGGNAAIFTPTDTLLIERVRVSVTTLLDALKGQTFHVYARMSGAVTAGYSFQFSYYLSSGATGGEIQEPVVTVAQGSWTGTYADFHLGKMHVPDNVEILSGLTLELSAARTSGTGNLNMDFLALVPTDPLSRLTSTTDVSADESIFVESERHFADGLDSSGALKHFNVATKGPTPGRFAQGLSAVYLANGTEEEQFFTTLGLNSTVRVSYCPRYYS